MEESVAMDGRELMDDLVFFTFISFLSLFIHHVYIPVLIHMVGGTDTGPCNPIANGPIAVGQDAVAIG